MTWSKKFGALALAAAGTALGVYLGVAHAAVSQTMHAFVHPDDSIGLTFDDGSQVGNQAAVPPTDPPGTYSIRSSTTQAAQLPRPRPGRRPVHGHRQPGDPDVVGDAPARLDLQVRVRQPSRFHVRDVPDLGPEHRLLRKRLERWRLGPTGGSGTTSSGGTKSSSSSGGGATLAGTLAATLTPNGAVTLKSRGKTVSELDSGRYKVTISDRASARSFVLQRKGGKAVTI